MNTKQDCNVTTAEKILNLTLTGIVNESTQELGILYDYDANGTHPAELANLAYDVLRAVPVLSTFQNLPTGTAPTLTDRLVKKDFGDILAGVNIWELTDWLEVLEEMWESLMDWFESLIEAFIDLLSDLVAFVLESIGKVAEALGNLELSSMDTRSVREIFSMIFLGLGTITMFIMILLMFHYYVPTGGSA